MPIRHSIPLLVLVTAGVCHGQANRDQNWRQDIDSLAQTVTARHPAIYTNVSRERFEQELTALKDSVPAKTDAEIAIGMQRLLALAGDGHTSLYLFQGASRVRSLPIRFYWFADGIFVTEAGGSYVRALGAKLIAVEDTPVDDAVEKVKPFISHENQWWVRSQAPGLLASPEVLASAGIVASNAAPVRYRFEKPGAEPFTLTLQAATGRTFALPHKARPNPPLYVRYADRFYWMEYLPSSGTLYMKYNNCTESPVLGMEAFAQAMFDIYRTSPIERFVLDLRNNGGGNSAVIFPILYGIAQAKAEGAISASQLFTIVGRDTFSSGLMAAIDMKRLGATLVGEPTGNKPNHFGQVYSFALPNSRLTVSVSTRAWSYPDFPGDTLAPDVPVEVSSSDYFDERDPVLEAIIVK